MDQARTRTEPSPAGLSRRKRKRVVEYSAVFPFNPIGIWRDPGHSSSTDTDAGDRQQPRIQESTIPPEKGAFEEMFDTLLWQEAQFGEPRFGLRQSSPSVLASIPFQDEPCDSCKAFQAWLFPMLKSRPSQPLFPLATDGTLQQEGRGSEEVIADHKPATVYTHSRKYDNLRRSSQRCNLCLLIYRSLIKNNEFKLFDSMINNYSNGSFNGNTPYHSDGVSDLDYKHIVPVKFRLRISPSRGFQSDYDCIGLRLQFCARVMTRLDKSQITVNFVPVYQGPGPSPLGMRFPPDNRLRPSEKIELMRGWLAQARASGHVQQHSDDVEMPARILRIMEDEIKLVDVDNVLRHHELDSFSELMFAALSYRWGTSKPCRTTTATKEQHQAGIRLVDLPKTFQDAVFVCKQLGVEYIWIDALCIVQDSTEDWKRESLKMGDVYRGALIVLAVHNATDTTQGFLDGSLKPKKAVRLASDGGGEIDLDSRANFDADVTRSQLSKRGWVVQERFLASRTIHFTEGQIYWETPTGAECEIGPLPVPSRDDIFGNDSRRLNTSFSLSAVPELSALLHNRGEVSFATYRDTIPPTMPASFNWLRDPPPKPTTTLDWLNFVEMYSSCDLSHEEDKLVAVSGIARVLQRRTGGTSYCAGLWVDFLCQGLMWLPRMEPLTRPSHWRRPGGRAPTWSWAAVNGPVQYPDDVKLGKSRFDPVAEVAAAGSPHRTDGWLNEAGDLTLHTEVWPLVSKTKWHPPVVTSRKLVLGPGPRRPGTAAPTTTHRDKTRRWASNAPGTMTLHDYVPTQKIYQDGIQEGWIAFDTAGDAERWTNSEETLYCAVIALSPVFRFVIFLEKTKTPRSRTSSGSTPRIDAFRRVGAGQIQDQSPGTPGWKWQTIRII
ncbi:hypothetical protein VTK73DRAFT_198 [Phialemonium thermophilum]|uniref:Heterokaryon incompatibility domain-containing protein n=1 Tax=Phialemonium thermophilum TaxID=223376 RepID=A0ABR3XFQ6_9PEZI